MVLDSYDIPVLVTGTSHMSLTVPVTDHAPFKMSGEADSCYEIMNEMNERDDDWMFWWFFNMGYKHKYYAVMKPYTDYFSDLIHSIRERYQYIICGKCDTCIERQQNHQQQDEIHHQRT